MSKLSEEIAEAYEAITNAEGMTEDSIQVRPLGSGEDGIESVAGFLAAKAYYESRIQNEIRKSYRHHAGADLKPSGQEQFDAFRSEMLNRLTPTMISAFADGVLIGEKKTQPVRKAFHQDRVDEIFDSRAHRKDSDFYAITVSGDPDSRRLILEHLERTASSMAEGSGYLSFSQENRPEMVSKVWDLWVLASMSTMFSFYVVGNRLGEKWAEKDVFAAIEKEFE